MSDVLAAARLIAYTWAISFAVLILALTTTLATWQTVAVAMVPLGAVVLLDRGASDDAGIEEVSASR